jgi:hypothetical protein
MLYRRILTVSVLVLFAFGVPGVAAAQEIPLWVLGQHSRDIETAQAEIADIARRDMLPVGLHVAERQILVLYSLNLGSAPKEVLLYHFDDPETMEGEMNVLVDRGFAPMDIAETDDGVYAVLINNGFEIGAWTIVNAPFNTSTIEQVQGALEEQGYSPWGLAVHNNQAKILALAEGNDVPTRDVLLQTHRFHVDSYFPAINQMIQQNGLYPWGLAIQENQMMVQYARND